MSWSKWGGGGGEKVEEEEESNATWLLLPKYHSTQDRRETSKSLT